MILVSNKFFDGTDLILIGELGILLPDYSNLEKYRPFF